MGEKPLYYGLINGSFVFASELKAIKTFPGFSAIVDRGALGLFLKYSCVPAPYSIYEGVYKVEPGAVLKYFPEDRLCSGYEYWSSASELMHEKAAPFSGTFDAAVNELDGLLRKAVAQQMESDVPLGAFLSGGVDSSTVVSLMQAQSTKAIQTFSIGFEEKMFDEAQHARAVAAHLGTSHHDLYVSPQAVLDVIPKLPFIYDEPFSDSSQIPTYLVSAIAKERVTVCLTGDAGDELFGGYSRYQKAEKYWGLMSKLPLSLRRLSATGVRLISDPAISLLAGFKSSRTADSLVSPFWDRAEKMSGLLVCTSRSQFYHDSFLSHNNDALAWVQNSSELSTYFERANFGGLNFFEEMMAIDTMTYLPNDNLVKVDRASMSVSLETRVPFLDRDVFAFSCSLPIEFKVHKGVGKRILREVLYKYVPQTLIDRPKMGFAVPLAQWLRGPLRDWGEELLSESRLLHEGYFNARLVREKWDEHISGRRNWHYQLWDVLMFQSWLDSNK